MPRIYIKSNTHILQKFNKGHTTIPVGVSALGKFKTEGEDIPSLISDKDNVLNPTEAVYGFAAHITSGKGDMSLNPNKVVGALKDYFNAQDGMGDDMVRDNWTDFLKPVK